jgi:hypothetical protein
MKSSPSPVWLHVFREPSDKKKRAIHTHTHTHTHTQPTKWTKENVKKKLVETQWERCCFLLSIDLPAQTTEKRKRALNFFWDFEPHKQHWYSPKRRWMDMHCLRIKTCYLFVLLERHQQTKQQDSVFSRSR